MAHFGSGILSLQVSMSPENSKMALLSPFWASLVTSIGGEPAAGGAKNS